MSMSHLFTDNREHRNDDRRQLPSAREQLLGQIIVVLICLLAILLRAM